MGLMHRRRLAVHDSNTAWQIMGFTAAYVAVIVLIMVRHWPVRTPNVLAAAIVAAIFVPAIAGLLAFGILPWVPAAYLGVAWLAKQVHRLLMGAHDPSHLRDERERNSEPVKCPTCGGTYYVRREGSIPPS